MEGSAVATPTQIRGRGRWSLILGALLATLTFGAVMAFGDTVTNDVVAGGSDTMITGGSTTINYKINATGGDGQAGCNASDGSQATVNINAPAGVTATPSSLTFNYCGNPTKSVVFSSSTPGDYSITHNVSDSGTGSYSATPANFTLHVQAPPPPPNTAPQLTVPGPLTVEGNTTNGATVSFSVTATDAEDNPDPTPICDHAAGSFFALGTTTVTCSVTDSGGLSDSGFFSVTVVDMTPPSIFAPPNMTVEGNTIGGATVSYPTATATDIVDPSPSVACGASPSFFPLGTTAVTCTATDASGNSSSASLTITVVDTTPPSLSLPGNQTAEATSASGAVVNYTASAGDIVEGAVAVNCVPASGSTFVLGSTTVNCSATDSSGNTATGSFGVTVQDTTPPSLNLPSNITTTASGNSSKVVTYTASATDLVDGTVAVSCSQASGSSFPVGTTTVNCSATDSHNNTANGSFTVTVNYDWTGFFQPIDNGVMNVAKAGSTIPVKFSLSGNQGLNIFYSSSYPNSGKIDCSADPGQDAIEEYSTATVSGLKYDATADQYIYNWKTASNYAGTCRQLIIRLADGTYHRADFKFTK